ncbi:chemotaxis protein CheA [Alkalitalea saponilacus]|uniref:Chemotaxis protein CheA n=1 Tax=Alkalitalea saponilacus TaxID=889453 RepID=A0A1T5HSA3_9BACT|nr:chemotaxis protein CheA [Alkalitalea saponilacus]ASB48340.1 chemotaxis protein CheA [Alkalitalea saponilacus]SKC23563.1 two-component system, chemotaxis family, sensor kinase CheA [Alkalitalea saponilacus]
MIPNFENFQSKFIEEALDNISDLERALLELELSPNNKELLEQVFRVMHSLKGGGAMFGFDKLSEFTHRLENIYDMIRSGKLLVSQDLLTVTLNSVDLLRDLLDVSQVDDINTLQKYKDLTFEIDQVLQSETLNMINSVQSSVGNIKVSGVENDDVKQMTTYYIHFYPGPMVLKYGTNLLYLLEELKSLGNLFAIPRMAKVPDLDTFDSDKSYVYWDLFISTDMGQNAIIDVFMFVEDESIIEIHSIGKHDLFKNKRFKKRLDEILKTSDEIELSDFTGFLGEEPVAANNRENIMSGEALNNVKESNGKGRSTSSIRVSADKLDGLMSLVSELVITQERLNSISSKYQIPELKMVTETVQKLTGNLRDSAFSMSLIPIENMLTRFQRLVRDLSGQLGKKVRFVATGTETELDKTMIDSLTDPLLHIIRNSIDHGIESPEIRQKNGKSQEGEIRLEAEYSGANVVLRIKDDGAGIDPEKIRQKAIQKGLISDGQILTDQELLNMVFLAGFSTSDQITEVSGRGVGMDVVSRNILAIRGETTIESTPGKGTTITITLPLVLSIIDGLLVRIANTQYVIPLSLTDRIYPMDSEKLDNNFLNVMTLNGIQYPFFNLRKEMQINGQIPKRCQMVVVNHSGFKIALSVDQVIGKIQAVLKPLGKLYHSQKMISSATIMGDGSIALVLDVNTFIREAME